MSNKKTCDMNFREFILKEKTLGNIFIEELERDIISRMHVEGFPEEDIYNMPMPRLYGLYFQVLGEIIETEFSKISVDFNAESADHEALESLTKMLKESLERLEETSEEQKKS